MKRSPLKKRNSLGKLRNECDKLMQIIGKKKYPKSLLSGEPTQVMHHFFPKSVSSFHRYNWNNLIPLTNGEHMRLHQSGDPTYEYRIIEIMGDDWYENLAKHKRDYVKVNVAYYQQVFQELSTELDLLEN